MKNNFNQEPVENNEVINKKSNKGLIIFLLLIIIGLLTVIGLIYFRVIKLNEKECPKCEECKKVEQNNVDNENKKVEQNNVVNENKEVVNQDIPANSKLIIAEGINDDAPYEITWNSDKSVTVNSKYLNNVIAAKNIKRVYTVHFGQSDICEGNSVIVMLNEDNKISAISLDNISCGRWNELTYYKKLDSLKGIKNIYERAKFVNEYEPLSYTIKAQLTDGSELDITSYFK